MSAAKWWLFCLGLDEFNMHRVVLCVSLLLLYHWLLVDRYDVIRSTMASQTIGVSIVCSTVYFGEDQSSASLAFVGEIHRWPVDFPHQGPVTLKKFPFDDVIIFAGTRQIIWLSQCRWNNHGDVCILFWYQITTKRSKTSWNVLCTNLISDAEKKHLLGFRSHVMVPFACSIQTPAAHNTWDIGNKLVPCPMPSQVQHVT